MLNSGEVRTEDAGFLLDLLESGCSREEIETAMNIELHSQTTIRRFIQRGRMDLFHRLEEKFGFGFSLLLCLQLRLRKATESSTLFRTFAYPTVLVLTGYTVLTLYLFVIAPTIASNRALFQLKAGIPIQILQSALILLTLCFSISISFLIFRLNTRPYRIYLHLSKIALINPWSLSLSRKLAFHISKLHALGLSTREIYQEISMYPKEPVLALITLQILTELAEGLTPNASLRNLDPFLARILSIESHPDLVLRLMNYDHIVQKRYEYTVKKLGYIASISAYIFISILIFTLYREIMAPLDMLKNMR